MSNNPIFARNLDRFVVICVRRKMILNFVYFAIFKNRRKCGRERERDIYVQTMKNVISLCSICHFCLHFIIYLFQEILTHTHTHILNLHVESHCNMCKMVKTKFVSLRGPLSAPDCFDISSRLSTDTVESCRVCICRSRVYP